MYDVCMHASMHDIVVWCMNLFQLWYVHGNVNVMLIDGLQIGRQSFVD